MKAKTILFSLAAMLLLQGQGFTLDFHYSMFYESPLTLNPALTGKVNGSYRVGVMYRNQYMNLMDNPFVTPSVSFDIPLRFDNGDALGGGVYVLNDQHSAFSNIRSMLSGAYHKALGADNNSQISLGIQGGYVQEQVDRDDLTFADEYNSSLEESGNTSENLSGNSAKYPDFNAGALFNTKVSEDATVFVGGSYFHLIPLKRSFLDGDNKLKPRLLAHAGAEWDFAERYSMYPGFLYMNQASAQEMNFGTTFGYHFLQKPDQNASFYLGGWYRVGDAPIVQTAVEYQQFKVAFAYDGTVSDLQDGTANTANAFEISLSYIGELQVVKPDTYLFNPRF